MDRTKTEQEFLDYCIKKGKGKLPIAIDLLELITDFIEVDRQKQLLIQRVVGRSEQLVCDNCYDTDGFYLGTTCPKCKQPFRGVKAN